MNISRRQLLQTAAAAGPLAMMTRVSPAAASTTPSGTIVSAHARSLGYTSVLYRSAFRTSMANIDMNTTGASGFDWYTNYTWGGTRADPWQSYKSATDPDGTSYVSLFPRVNNCNWNLSTMDPLTFAGTAFRYGYFEVKSRFVTPPKPNWDPKTPPPVSWPSIWLASRGMLQRSSRLSATASLNPTYGEIDIYEALNGPGTASCTVHDWPGDKELSTRSAYHYVDTFTQSHTSTWFTNDWHTYSVSWKPGLIEWFVDGVLFGQRAYSTGSLLGLNTASISETMLTRQADTDALLSEKPPLPAPTFSCLDRDAFTLVLGTGEDNPMDVASVAVYGNNTSVVITS